MALLATASDWSPDYGQPTTAGLQQELVRLFRLGLVIVDEVGHISLASRTPRQGLRLFILEQDAVHVL